MAMLVRPECAIAHTALSYPVLVYTHRPDEHGFEIVGDVDANDGLRANEAGCQERFNIDAIANHIARSLVDRIEVLCPNCNRHLDGIRLDVAQLSHLEEEPYRMVGNPQVLSLATEIARQFRASNLVRGQARVQELTIEQMIAMRDRLIEPVILPDNKDEKEEQCVCDSCVSQAGPVALVVGLLFAAMSMVRFVITPASAPEEPKRTSDPSRGNLVSLDYLNTKC